MLNRLKSMAFAVKILPFLSSFQASKRLSSFISSSLSSSFRPCLYFATASVHLRAYFSWNHLKATELHLSCWWMAQRTLVRVSESAGLMSAVKPHFFHYPEGRIITELRPFVSVIDLQYWLKLSIVNVSIYFIWVVAFHLKLQIYWAFPGCVDYCQEYHSFGS